MNVSVCVHSTEKYECIRFCSWAKLFLFFASARYTVKFGAVRSAWIPLQAAVQFEVSTVFSAYRRENCHTKVHFTLHWLVRVFVSCVKLCACVVLLEKHFLRGETFCCNRILSAGKTKALALEAEKKARALSRMTLIYKVQNEWLHMATRLKSKKCNQLANVNCRKGAAKKQSTQLNLLQNEKEMSFVSTI